MDSEPRDPADWVREFQRRCALVQSAAEEWAVRWQEPEGRFIAALLGAIQTFSRLAVAAEASIMAGVREGRAGAEAELARLTVALDTAREVSRQADQAIKQARNAQLAAVVQQEAVTQRMIDETLPMFAESLKGVLFIREARWNRERAWKRYALVGLACLAVFGSGYALSSWADQDRLSAFNRCLAQPIASGGHVYCALDWAAAQSAPPAASGTTAASGATAGSQAADGAQR
ncbi:MAG: hypothetical protein ABI369_02800 [Acetobacteraceae bacterium]